MMGLLNIPEALSIKGRNRTSASEPGAFGEMQVRGLKGYFSAAWAAWVENCTPPVRSNRKTQTINPLFLIEFFILTLLPRLCSFKRLSGAEMGSINPRIEYEKHLLNNMLLSASTLIGQDSAPEAFRAPDP